ncbi:hypothetical protein C0J52_25581 [Blattella germanica]|nr:hypothetical protein C0J52_25581 [Blattella germanica]
MDYDSDDSVKDPEYVANSSSDTESDWYIPPTPKTSPVKRTLNLQRVKNRSSKSDENSENTTGIIAESSGSVSERQGDEFPAVKVAGTLKRKRNQKEWKKSQRKHKRQAGKEYINSKGAFVTEKKCVYKNNYSEFKQVNILVPPKTRSNQIVYLPQPKLISIERQKITTEKKMKDIKSLYKYFSLEDTQLWTRLFK